MGYTLLELLLVLGIFAIVATLVTVGTSRIQTDEEDRAAMTTFRLAVAHGASAASARGERLTLTWQGNELALRDEANVIRRWPFPADTATNLTPGTLATFTPSGRIEHLEALPDPVTFTWRGETRNLTLSLIGQSRMHP